MTRRGHTVYHYGLENSNVKCSENIYVSNIDTLKQANIDPEAWKTNGFNQDVNNLAFSVFNKNATREIRKKLRSPEEFVLCWFGFGHQECAEAFRNKAVIVEPSIGYDSMFADVRIFETYVHMHKMHGLYASKIEMGKDYVTYPGFDPADFIYSDKKDDYALFLGRVIEGKGAKLAYDICNKLRHKIIFAGPNILGLKETEYCKFAGFVEPKRRAELLSKARFLFAPSLFAEPCNWAVIEAQFCGTPAITTDFGGFCETVVQGETGVRCPTIKSMISAIENIDKFSSPKACVENALAKYTLEHQCNNYEFIFGQL